MRVHRTNVHLHWLFEEAFPLELNTIVDICIQATQAYLKTAKMLNLFNKDNRSTNVFFVTQWMICSQPPVVY